MAKTKTISKATKLKMIKAAQTLNAFPSEKNDTPASKALNVLPVTDTYILGKTGSGVTFSLIFNNKGVGALTDAELHNVTDPDKVLVKGGRDSQINIAIGTDNNLNAIFLNINAVVAATNLTPLPSDLDVDFSITGGIVPRTYTIPPAQFKNVGDSFIIDISIFLFQS